MVTQQIPQINNERRAKEMSLYFSVLQHKKSRPDFCGEFRRSSLSSNLVLFFQYHSSLNLVTYPDKLWPDGEIPYVLEERLTSELVLLFIFYLHFNGCFIQKA